MNNKTESKEEKISLSFFSKKMIVFCISLLINILLYKLPTYIILYVNNQISQLLKYTYVKICLFYVNK